MESGVRPPHSKALERPPAQCPSRSGVDVLPSPEIPLADGGRRDWMRSCPARRSSARPHPPTRTDRLHRGLPARGRRRSGGLGEQGIRFLHRGHAGADRGDRAGAPAGRGFRLGCSGRSLSGGFCHMAGGLVPVPAHWPYNPPNAVLYSLWLISDLLKYDQIVHAYGFGVTTLAVLAGAALGGTGPRRRAAARDRRGAHALRRRRHGLWRVQRGHRIHRHPDDAEHQRRRIHQHRVGLGRQFDRLRAGGGLDPLARGGRHAIVGRDPAFPSPRRPNARPASGTRRVLAGGVGPARGRLPLRKDGSVSSPRPGGARGRHGRRSDPARHPADPDSGESLLVVGDFFHSPSVMARRSSTPSSPGAPGTTPCASPSYRATTIGHCIGCRPPSGSTSSAIPMWKPGLVLSMTRALAGATSRWRPRAERRPGESAAPCGHVCGHLHPAIRLGDRRVRGLTAPCFWVRNGSVLVLPSFGAFTGSVAISPEAGDRVFAVTADRVLEVPGSLLGVETGVGEN